LVESAKRGLLRARVKNLIKAKSLMPITITAVDKAITKITGWIGLSLGNRDTRTPAAMNLGRKELQELTD